MIKELQKEESITIEIPNWCKIGKIIEWKDEKCVADNDPYWYKEKILSFGYDGFFHQAHNCPVYYSKFSDYGKTIRECEFQTCLMQNKRYFTR